MTTPLTHVCRDVQRRPTAGELLKSSKFVLE